MDATQRIKLPEELRVMPFNLRFLELVGLWGPRGQLYRFYLAVTFAAMVILFPKAVLGIGSSDVTAICKGIAEFVFELAIFVNVTIIAVKRKSLESVIQGLGEIFYELSVGEESDDNYDMILKLNLKMRKFFNFLILYSGCAPFAFCLPSLIINHWRFWNNHFPLNFELPMEQEFYGLHIRKNFTHYHIFVAFSIAAYCICAFLELIKIATTCFIIKYSSLTYRLIATMIKKLPNNDKDMQTTVDVEKLKEIVELHRKAYNITNQIEEICQIPVALEFLTCVMFWCLNMIYISNKVDLNLVSVLIIFWLSLVQTFSFSYLGSELAEEAAAVGKAIFDLSWYEHPVELQRCYRLIIQRTQRPTGITGAKLFFVHRTTFASVMQMSYSYYLVLNDVLSKL
nr:odorant receptor 28 [Culex quinquefasciatus]